MISSTVDRVPQHTAQHINDLIRQQGEERVARAAEGGPAAIDRRLNELDREWDIERTLEANAATAVLLGVSLGAVMDRRFFYFPALVGGFLLLHAIQGWCPPLPILRRMGFRTTSEIEQERYALKTLRGDFRNVAAAHEIDPSAGVHLALQAVER